MMEPQHQYKNVPSNEHHDDDSSTEVESLVGMEKQWATEGFMRRSRRSKRNMCMSILAASKWFVVIGLQLIMIALLARDQGLLRELGLGKGRSTSAAEIGGDITGWGPHSKTSPPIPTPASHTHLTACLSPHPSNNLQNQPNLRAIQHVRLLQARDAARLERAHARRHGLPAHPQPRKVP